MPGNHAAGRHIANIKRLQRVCDVDPITDRLRRGDVQRVQQLGQRYGGGTRLSRVLVGSGIGEYQGFGSGADRVQKQLSIFGTDIAFTGHRVASQGVVSVDGAEPREHAVVEPDETDDPMRDRPHGHHGADREGAGAKVGARGAARQVAIQECANIAEPQRDRHGRILDLGELA
ncbi:Uncharacterised protein [Mycobacteroides abscessus subsp. abscessus]|nr:Uncharacterised protein [Mycobacteroides abscessus subsp. abscessus]